MQKRKESRVSNARSLKRSSPCKSRIYEKCVVWGSSSCTSFQNPGQSSCPPFQVEGQVQVKYMPKCVIRHPPTSCLQCQTTSTQNMLELKSRTLEPANFAQCVFPAASLYGLITSGCRLYLGYRCEDGSLSFPSNAVDDATNTRPSQSCHTSVDCCLCDCARQRIHRPLEEGWGHQPYIHMAFIITSIRLHQQCVFKFMLHFWRQTWNFTTSDGEKFKQCLHPPLLSGMTHDLLRSNFQAL